MKFFFSKEKRSPLCFYFLVLEGERSVVSLELLDGFIEMITVGAREVSIVRNGLAALLELALADFFDDALNTTWEIVGNALSNALGDCEGAFELVLVLAGAGRALEPLELAVMETGDGVDDGENEAGGDEGDESGDDGEEAGHYDDDFS